MVAHIGRLIQKWLKAGILEDGVVTVSERGTGQGAVISPLLANVYLHYVRYGTETGSQSRILGFYGVAKTIGWLNAGSIIRPAA